VIPQKLVISYFKSFRDKQTFYFQQKPGLFYLVGRNELYPEKGGNGTGKSSLLDAWCWVQFGKTASGQFANAVVNWEKSGPTYVVYYFKLNNQQYKITRQQSPNSLKLLYPGEIKSRTVTQEVIDELLGFDYDLFLATILTGQDADHFFKLKPTDKLNVFSKILNLDYWLDKASEASKLGKQATELAIKLESEAQSLQAQTHLLKQQIVGEQKLADAFEVEQEKKIVKVREEVEGCRVEYDQINESLTGAKAEADKRHTDLNKLIDQQTDLKKRLNPLKTKHGVAIDVQIERRVTADGLGKQLQRLKESDSVCPTCGQKAPHIAREAARVRKLFVEATEQERQAFDDVRAVEQSLFDLEGDLEKLEKDVRYAEGLFRAAEENERNTKSLLKDAQRDLQQAETELHDLKTETNRHDEMIKQLEAKIRQLTADSVSVNDKLALARADENGYGYWAKELKNVRLWLITEALKQLEIECNNPLRELGLIGWQITFDVETLTQAGTVSKGFAVFIKSPTSKDKVRWESWSGGEKNRLVMAGRVGLAKLIRDRYGITCPAECHDEQSNNLSVEGVQDQIEYLANRAIDQQYEIWLVSHDANANGAFSGRAEIVLTNDGSIIQQ